MKRLIAARQEIDPLLEDPAQRRLLGAERVFADTASDLG
jgi:hypothetical protein